MPPQTCESIGRRIARLRQQNGWTQQSLAARLAISRVAVSHIEMDLSVPSERTITLLAGLFKLAPYELVDGTTYPQAKAERLPLATCSYTAVEQQLSLLENDLAWLERLGDRLGFAEQAAILQGWHAGLSGLLEACPDERERLLVQQALARLALKQTTFSSKR